MKSLSSLPFCPRKLSFIALCLVLLTSVLYAPPAALSQGSPGYQRPAGVLYRFHGSPDGAYPGSALVMDAAGNLYGTTVEGGDANCPQGQSCGTVFELSKNASGSWTEKILHSFQNDAGGWAPRAGLVIDGSGNLYGANTYGGSTSAACLSYSSDQGCGTIYKLSPNANGSWTETTIHTFQGADGVFPYYTLAIDSEGNLYGTTYYGGDGHCVDPSGYCFIPGIGYGTVFQLKPVGQGWTENVLYSFPYGGNDATLPASGLLIDNRGNLYGTAGGGEAEGDSGPGCSGSIGGCGTIFKIAPVNGGWAESVLYRFGQTTTPINPEGGLVSDTNGNLYGTTAQGGNIYCVIPGGPAGCGSVYELTSAGAFLELYDFSGGQDGASPTGTLALRDGALYGSTLYGGYGGDQNGCYASCGTVFELAPGSSGSWTETVLYRFLGGSEGLGPNGVIFGPGGNLYGTTGNGGISSPNGGWGTIFEIAGTDSTGIGTSPPTFSPASGVYTSAQTVTIADTTPGAALYYTTDGTTPTAASTLYTGPIHVASTERLAAAALVTGKPPAIASAVYTIAPGSSSTLNYGEGFAASAGLLQLNGNAQLNGSNLQLTPPEDAMVGSAFTVTPANIQSFTTYFTFQLLDPEADGFTFAIQNSGPGSLGRGGEGLGYFRVGKSVAIKFDLHNNAGEGPNSTGLYVNGAVPTVPAINLTGTGIDLHSTDAFLAKLTYDGANLALTLTDTVTLATWSHTFAIDIPGTVGGDTAYIGFTGSTGYAVADQQILSWTYVSGAPGASAPPYTAPALPEFANGFSPANLATNGSAAVPGTLLQLTDGGNYEAASAYYTKPLNIQAFTTDFTFQLTDPFQPSAEMADGIAFVIQNTAADALGGDGGYLGYGGIGKSAAIKFDLYSNDGEGPNSTGLYLDGAPPILPAVTLAGTGIDLHSGDPFTAHIVYNGADLALTLTDTVTLATWSHSFAVNLPATVGANTAFVGFTGGTGDLTATQRILRWTFTNP